MLKDAVFDEELEKEGGRFSSFCMEFERQYLMKNGRKYSIQDCLRVSVWIIHECNWEKLAALDAGASENN